MIGISQVQGVGQQLNLAPQLLQWLKLLQVTSVELNQLVQHELETNPVLELDSESPEVDPAAELEIEDAEIPVAGSDDPEVTSFDQKDFDRKMDVLREIDEEWQEDAAKGAYEAASTGMDDNDLHQFMMDSLVAPTSLFEHLSRQLLALRVSAADWKIAEVIIGSLDQRGYLDATIKELAAQAQSSEAEVEQVLEVIHHFDPPGIAARDLRECLLLQLNPDKNPLSYVMIKDQFDLVAARNVSALAEALDAEEDDIAEALDVIARLNPAPGRDVEEDRVEYITPDVIVRKEAGRCIVDMNEEFVPNLRISSECRNLLTAREQVTSADLAYLRRKMRSAKFLIQGIAQRQETLFKVASEIVRVQREFFDSKDGAMGSLTMVRVARVVGVHETTISRAISGKYMKTPRGIYPMRAFFEAGYSCADGSTITSGQVKKIITEIVGQEPKSKPATDVEISAELKKRGLNVARRTVAKYREEMGVLSSKERTMLTFRMTRAPEDFCEQPVLAVATA